MKRQIVYDTRDIPYQTEFHDSIAPNVYLSSGFGGGKTYSLIMKMFRLMNINRGCPGGLLAPSFKMYKRDVVPTIKDICRINKIRYHYNKSDMVWFFPDAAATVWAFTSEDDGESVKGPNLAWFCINEVTLCSENAAMMAFARVRLKRAKLLQVAMSGTPEGFNWCYDYFITKPRADTHLIYGNSRLNRHVAGAYFSRLEEQYDPLMQKQYIDGQFVNLTGKPCVWAFNRLKHTAPGINRIPGLPVWVSMDFNVAPMAATLWNRVPAGFDIQSQSHQSAGLRAFDEIEITSSNTDEMCRALKDRLCNGQDPVRPEEIVVYPDPAGRARSTKSNFSDFDILKQHGFTQLKYKTQLSVKDCLNALNGVVGRQEMVLNRDKCPQTIADFEQCQFKGNVFEIDKSNDKRTHWLDGAKNMADYEFPIKRASFREQRYR